MNKPIFSRFTLAVLAVTALHAQDISGAWQGTIAAGQELRTVIKISKTPGDILGATLYSIDQPQAPPIQVTSVTFQGSILKLTIAAMGATYEGKLGGDGNTITGTLAMGPTRCR